MVEFFFQPIHYLTNRKMKIIFLPIVFGFCFINASAQLEVSTGYAINREYSHGAPLQIAYDLKIKNRLYTKPQIGFKYLYYYNDFVEATLKYSIIEFHQTLSYEVIQKKKYILKPNIGLNYRFYFIKAEMKPPFNTRPQRAWILDIFRNQKRIRLNSFDGDGTKTDKREVNNIGFSFQLQNQFSLSEKIWLQITPFIEPDYDRIQNTGGCYIGIIFKHL